MAALDFPSSPTIGDTYVAGGRTWQWNGTYWRVVGSSGVGNGLVSKTEFIDINTDGLTGTWTRLNFMDVQGDLKAGRTYRIVASGWFNFTGGDGTANLLLCKGDSFGAGNANILSFERINVGSIAIDAGRRLWVEYLYTPTVDEHDQLFTAWGAFDAASGTMSHQPRTTAPAFFYIEDVTLSSGGGGGGSDFDGNHVLTGDPTNPPAELLVNQLLWDGDSTLVSSGTDWTAVTFQNGWTDFAEGWQATEYRRIGDTVELRGMVKKPASPVDGQAIFTLPVGFRPSGREIFSVMTDGATDFASRIDVMDYGEVRYRTTAGATTGWISLSGISFSVTP